MPGFGSSDFGPSNWDNEDMMDGGGDATHFNTVPYNQGRGAVSYHPLHPTVHGNNGPHGHPCFEYWPARSISRTASASSSVPHAPDAPTLDSKHRMGLQEPSTQHSITIQAMELAPTTIHTLILTMEQFGINILCRPFNRQMLCLQKTRVPLDQPRVRAASRESPPRDLHQVQTPERSARLMVSTSGWTLMPSSKARRFTFRWTHSNISTTSTVTAGNNTSTETPTLTEDSPKKGRDLPPLSSRPDYQGSALEDSRKGYHRRDFSGTSTASSLSVGGLSLSSYDTRGK
jgi:hypothetical protein